MDRIAIAGPSPDTPRLSFRFKLYGNRCVFSEMRQTSDASYAVVPHVIEAIGRTTGKDPKTLRFFDFQKRRNTARTSGFEFDEVVIDQSGTPNWAPARCPQTVTRDFVSRRLTPRQVLRFQPISKF